MRSKVSTLFIAISFLFAVPALAEVIKWIDDTGATHYTDDINKIPLKYRPKEKPKPKMKPVKQKTIRKKSRALRPLR
jgi:hypothetical protein